MFSVMRKRQWRVFWILHVQICRLFLQNECLWTCCASAVCALYVSCFVLLHGWDDVGFSFLDEKLACMLFILNIIVSNLQLCKLLSSFEGAAKYIQMHIMFRSICF